MASENPRTAKILIIVASIVIIIGLIVIVALTFILAKRARLATNANPCQSITPPLNVETTTINLTQIQVTWTAVRTATRYRVYIGSVSGFSQANPIDVFNTTETNYTIVGMVLGRTYYVRVSAINTCGGESPLSPEKIARLGFPRKFFLVSRANPNLALRVGPDFETIIVDSRCSGGRNDDLCVWQYDNETGLIQGGSNSLLCMKTLPAAVDTRVKYGDCSVFPYSNSFQARQWNFNTANGSICNPKNPEGLNCIKINGPAIPGQAAIRIPFDGTPTMQFDIVNI